MGSDPKLNWGKSCVTKKYEHIDSVLIHLKLKGSMNMKLCFPVDVDNGLERRIFGHFGSAPFFVVFDTDTEEVSSIDNQDLGHIHGQCNPMKALNGKMMDAGHGDACGHDHGPALKPIV